MTSPAPEADKANDECNRNKGGQVSDTASSGSGDFCRGSTNAGVEVCVLSSPRFFPGEGWGYSIDASLGGCDRAAQTLTLFI